MTVTVYTLTDYQIRTLAAIILSWEGPKVFQKLVTKIGVTDSGLLLVEYKQNGQLNTQSISREEPIIDPTTLFK